MSSDRDLNDPGHDGGPEDPRPEKETAPPPPLFDAPDEATRVMDTTKDLLAHRAKADAGLRQMFSRDPAPVREALPTADEGDALLDMLFEDAKGDRPSAEPAEDMMTTVLRGPVDDRGVESAARSADAVPPSARSGPPPLPPPTKSAPGAAAPPPRPGPPPRPASPPRPPGAPSRQPPLPSRQPPLPAPAPPPRLPVRVEAREELETLDADPDERISVDRVSSDRLSAPAKMPAIAPPPAVEAARDSGDVLDLEAPAPEEDANYDATEIQERPNLPSQAPIRPSRAPDALAPEHGEDAAAQLARNKKHEAWAIRAAWLREEAQADTNRATRSRGMLVVSELCAMIGDEQNARAAAAEARELAPSSPLPHRQVRGLLARQGEWPAVLEELEGEGKSVSTPAARCHLALFGAEIARLALGDAEQANRRLELALRILPSDPRPHAHRIAAALADSDASPDAAAALQKTRLPEAEELAPLAGAMETLLAHRGLAPKTRTPTTPYESVLRARAELDGGQPAAALEHLLGVLGAESLGGGGGWLVASLAAARKETRPRAVERLRALLDGSHASLARRSLAARAIELGDAEAAKTAIDSQGSEAFTPGDRVALAALAGGTRADVETWQEPLWNDEDLAPIAAAIDALEPASAERIPRAIGTAPNRAGVTLGRALAAGALGPIADAVGLYADAVPGSGVDSALTLELFAATGAGGKIATLVAGWREDGELERERMLASALIAEVSGESQRAQDNFEKIRGGEASLEAAVRARLPHVEDSEAAEMLAELAEATERGTRAALLFTEAAIRVSDDSDKADALLRKASELDPKLPFPPHLGERAARARGDRDGLVEWLRTRREASDDPIEQAHDLVREALLLSDADGSPATGLLEQALQARPADVGLRELYERLSPEPPSERGAGRLARAQESQGAEAARLAIEAGFEFERVRDWEKVAEASRIALAGGDTTLAPIVAYRAALNGQGAGDVIDGLLPTARRRPTTSTSGSRSTRASPSSTSSGARRRERSLVEADDPRGDAGALADPAPRRQRAGQRRPRRRPRADRARHRARARRPRVGRARDGRVAPSDQGHELGRHARGGGGRLPPHAALDLGAPADGGARPRAQRSRARARGGSPAHRANAAAERSLDARAARRPERDQGGDGRRRAGVLGARDRAGPEPPRRAPRARARARALGQRGRRRGEPRGGRRRQRGGERARPRPLSRRAPLARQGERRGPSQARARASRRDRPVVPGRVPAPPGDLHRRGRARRAREAPRAASRCGERSARARRDGGAPRSRPRRRRRRSLGEARPRGGPRGQPRSRRSARRVRGGRLVRARLGRRGAGLDPPRAPRPRSGASSRHLSQARGSLRPAHPERRARRARLQRDPQALARRRPGARTPRRPVPARRRPRPRPRAADDPHQRRADHRGQSASAPPSSPRSTRWRAT